MPTPLSPEDHRPPPPRRLLVADADVDARLLYRMTFQEVGYDVVEASDGRDALTKALVREPSLVVTELHLPLIDGFGLCEILRRDRMTARVPIIVVTTETRPTEVTRARRAGADVVFSKPVLPATLRATSRLLLEAHELRGRSTAARENAARHVERSAELLARSDQHWRTNLTKAYQRFTTMTPPTTPPELACPSCGSSLTHEWSHVGGVSARYPEQWDYFTCATCGSFQYRHRTRKLRHLRPLPRD